MDSCSWLASFIEVNIAKRQEKATSITIIFLNKFLLWYFSFKVNNTIIVERTNNQLKSSKYLDNIPAICVSAIIIINANIIDKTDI